MSSSSKGHSKPNLEPASSASNPLEYPTANELLKPTANELLKRVGLSPRPGGDGICVPVTEALWESVEDLRWYVQKRVHLHLDLDLRGKTKEELFAIHGAEELLGGEQTKIAAESSENV